MTTSYQQTYPNSCGAASLLCAAIDLGITQLPSDANIHPLWVGGCELDKGPTKQSETIVYALTSGSKGAPTKGSGYSVPSNIAKACQAMGISATAYVPTGLVTRILLAYYPKELANAEAYGMKVFREAPPRPTGKQLLLRIIRVGADKLVSINSGLHYILERPNGWVMDPALGWEHSSLDQLKLFHQKMYQTSYVDSGIGIMLSV